MLVKRKETAEAPKGVSCWNCYYKKNKQMSVFGECAYFNKLGRQPKEIPSDIANKGCQFFLDKREHHPIVQKILTLFDGEFLPEDNDKKGRYIYSSKKYTKSKSKYTKRADWDG